MVDEGCLLKENTIEAKAIPEGRRN